MIKKILLLIVVIIPFNQVWGESREYPNKVFEEIGEYLKGPTDLKKEDYYANFLRENICVKNELVSNKNSIDESILLARQMLSNIRKEYPNVTDKEYKKAWGSVGAALFNKKDNKISINKKLDILVREANLLSGGAQIMLEILYKYGSSGGLQKYSPKILSIFKELSDDRCNRGEFQYGKILLHGIGVPKNQVEGEKLLNLSGLEEARMELAYYYRLDNEKNFEKYIRLAANEFNPEAWYHLGIIEKNRGNYNKSILMFNKSLQINAQYYPSLLELGKLYLNGEGVDKNKKKGLELLEQVARNSEDKVLRVMALSIVENYSK